MSQCNYIDRIEAYHDGEIVGDERRAIESHLVTCDACAEQLRQLQSMSAILAAAPQARLSQIALHRLHHRLDAATDGGLLRLGWAMSGIAAGLLIVASIAMALLQQQRPTSSQATAMSTAAPPWVGVSTVAETDPAVREAAATPAAEWYLADAGTRNDDTP
jgi:anti-sigma factor RsiW